MPKRSGASTASSYTDADDNKSVATGTAFGGGKTIGFGAGICLLINNITGPGVPSIANMYAESGWFLPSFLFILIWCMSSLSTGMYCEAMRMIPGNEHFRGRIEYTTIVKHYFGEKFFRASQLGLNGALQSLNIISVIQSAQLMDAAISAIFGKSCGFNLTPFSLTFDGSEALSGEGSTPIAYPLPEATKFWSCIDTNNLDDGNAWGCHGILSAGFITSLVFTLPMGMWNLDENMGIQVGAFILTVVCWFVWFFVAFYSENFKHDAWQIPAFTDSSKDYASQAGVLGTVLFNYGYVTCIPSWVNEKKMNVSINKSVWTGSLICNFVFFALGISGCMAFHQFLAGPATGKCEKIDGYPYSCANTVLNIFTTPKLMKTMIPDIHNHGAANFIAQLSVYLFIPGAVLSGIPVFSIVVKYNCIENGCSKRFSDFWGIVFPWLIAIPLLYQPDALNQFITYSSLIFVSFTDFIVPWYLYYFLLKGKVQGTIDIEAESDDSDEERNLVKVNDSFHLSEFEEGTIPVHWAFPPQLNLSLKARKNAALVLVFIMGTAAVSGTIFSIATSATNSWNCAGVGT
eukprot:TRINITY_DN1308_c0_g3_i1.p1 TRINITY_DN1308_c0_g3~~TRINITY_DN1308_c0_g3_i1.p1  ORF type:complete len:596 (+),score=98.99 TRINITY_DN1308_c0_g3_i1:72-1790(+)